MTTTTKKHRAAEPLPATARAELSGGAHRSPRTTETVLVIALGTLLIAFAMVMALRG